MKKDIHVLGYFGKNNAGDDAFADFWHRRAKIPRDRICQSLSKAEGVSEVILGGGAVVNDYFVQRLPKELKKLHLVGVSFPYGNSDYSVLDGVRERIGRFVLRSRRDFDAAIAGGYTEAEYAPDLVFGHQFMETSFQKVSDLYPYATLPIGTNLKKKNLIVLLSANYKFSNAEGFSEGETFKFRLAHALDELAPYYNIVLLPFSVEHSARDYIYAGDVVARMKEKLSCLLVEQYLGADQLYSAIKGLGDCVVSMKYHGLVFSACAGVPFVNIGNTRKNHDLCTDASLNAFSVPTPKFDVDEFLLAIKRAEMPETRQTVSNLAATNRSEVDKLLGSLGHV